MKDPSSQPWWLGIRGVMVALFTFALLVAMGAYLVKPGDEHVTFDLKYWAALKALIIVGCMLGFLGFWGLMLWLFPVRSKSKL